MFFALSKIAWAILSPLNLVLLLLLGGALVGWFRRRTGRILAVTGVLILIIAGVTPLGANLLVRLENRHVRPEKQPEIVSGILILGGAFDTGLSAARHVAVSNDNMERVLEGVRLAKEYPLAEVVFSGGEGKLLRRVQPEAREATAWLRNMGFEPARFTFEDKSRNTYENILYTQEMINPGPQEIWIVVTSAYHMERTMGVFRALGWGNIIPWPTDYRTDGEKRWLPEKFDVAGNVYKTDLALHEFAGITAYWISGKITSP
ncbi:MAG TPA: YdcF family protein [Micavibrio sp.]